MIGETAAVLTAICWAGGSLLFTFAGRRIGSTAVNQIRLWFAFILMIPLHRIMLGSTGPWDAGMERWMWLGLSGFVGYVIGDALLFESFVRIGPRLAMLLMTAVPIFSALLGFVFLGERLVPLEMAAIAITIAGIGWVVTEKKRPDATGSKADGLGILLGLGGAFGQAAGLLLAKNGLTDGFSAISGNFIRVSVAAVSMAVIMMARGQLMHQFSRLKDRVAAMQLAGASSTGPVLGVILSLVAISHAKIGVAATLMSLSPLVVIPLSAIFLHERITVRAVVGTLVAVVGSVMLFF